MIKNLLQQGFALKNKGYYKQAIEVFYKALELDNSSEELLMEIAELYYKLGNEEKALNYLEQILDSTPNHIGALKLLKQIFLNKNALAEAEQTAKNIYCISHNTNDLAEIFELLNLQGKQDEIFEYKIEDFNIDIVYELAKAYYCKKEFLKAQNLIEQNIENNICNQDLLFLLAQILFAQNKKEECIKLLPQLKEDCSNPELLNFRGLIEDYKENYAEACSFFREAIKLEPQNDKFYYNIANSCFKNGENKLAKKYYNTAISLAPDNLSYQFALANFYYAEKLYKRALEFLPEDFFEAKILKIIILYETGYFAFAQKELNKMLIKYPNNIILKEYSIKIKEKLGIS